MATTNDIINELNKKYGKGTVVTEAENIDNVIPTGSINLDIATGVGGYPFGKLVEIFGVPSGGKSTLALTACKMAQKLGIIPVYIDVEHSLDLTYAENIGVNLENMILTQPDHAEQALGIIEHSIGLGSKLVILDSVGNLSSHKEAIDEAELGDALVGVIPRLMSQSLRRLIPLTSKHDATIIYLNQIRAKIGGMGPATTDTPGGYALKHAMTMRIKIARTGTNKNGDEAVSNSTIATVEKNKVAPPYRKAEFDIIFGEGIDYLTEIVHFLSEEGKIKKSGSWYKTADGISIGQGSSSVKEWLKSSTNLYKEALMSKYPFLKLDMYD